MAAVDDTGVVRISVTTPEAQQSLDICSAVYLEAPEAIKKVVEMGNMSRMDPPYLPLAPNPHNTMRRSMRGALLGGAAAALYHWCRKRGG